MDFNIVRASEWDFILPRPVRDGLKLGLAAGVLLVPTVRHWYVDQVCDSAQDRVDIIVTELLDTIPAPPPQPTTTYKQRPAHNALS